MSKIYTAAHDSYANSLAESRSLSWIAHSRHRPILRQFPPIQIHNPPFRSTHRRCEECLPPYSRIDRFVYGESARRTVLKVDRGYSRSRTFRRCFYTPDLRWECYIEDQVVAEG